MAEGPSTRERLIEAAISVMSREGEVGVRVDVIAEMAGVTKPSLYHFFGDRDGLVTAAYAEMYRRSIVFGLPELLEAVRNSGSKEEYRDIIIASVASFFSPEGVKRRALRLSVLGSADTRPGLRELIVEVNRAQMADFAEIVRTGVERGWATLPFDPGTTGLWWWGMVNGRHLAEIDPAADLAEWDRVARDAVLHLLFGPEHY